MMSKDDIEALNIEEKYFLVESGKIFSIITLITGICKKLINIIFCKCTWVFTLVTIIMINNDLFKNLAHFNGYLILAGVFIFYEGLVFLLKNKTNVNINGSFGFSKNINKQA